MKPHFLHENELLPVHASSWQDCQEFCRKTGLSLPTEAQWEYACRAGTTTPFSFGETITRDHAQFLIAAELQRLYRGGIHQAGKPVAVESKLPNSFGLHNMHGNVAEWCQDLYDSDFYSQPQASESDPVCSTGSGYRVLRGGWWIHPTRLQRSAIRKGVKNETSRYAGAGLRPAFPFR